MTIYVVENILIFRRIHISSQCFPYFPRSLRGTQITSDLGTRGGYRGIPKTRQPFWKGIPISLGIWVRGYPKHGDTQITVTPLSILHSRFQSHDLSRKSQVPNWFEDAFSQVYVVFFVMPRINFGNYFPLF